MGNMHTGPGSIATQPLSGESLPFEVKTSGIKEGPAACEPRLLKIGRELIVAHTGPTALKNVDMIQVPRSLRIDPEHQEPIRQMQETLAADPFRWDGQKWRTERIIVGQLEGERRVIIEISPMMYSEHDYLRKQRFADRRRYPNPITVVGTVETLDGYLLFGVKDGQISDQTGIGSLGSGFIERDGMNAPDSVAWHARHEIADEVSFLRFPGATAAEVVFVNNPGSDPKNPANWMKDPCDPEQALLMGHAFGSNHDTANQYYQPTMARSEQVRLRFHQRENKGSKEWRSEHQLAVLVPNSDEMLDRILLAGSIEIPSRYLSGFTGANDSAHAVLADHALAAIYFYRHLRDTGSICPQHRRDDCELRFVTAQMSLGT